MVLMIFFLLLLYIYISLFLEIKVMWHLSACQLLMAETVADMSLLYFIPVSFCRLLQLQVMPLSHLHASHFLLVQTRLVLYLSALLLYPQVRTR